MRKPGSVQLTLLENLAFISHGIWIKHYSGWHWGGHGNTERLMETLARRGFVELRMSKKFKRQGYHLTLEGAKALLQYYPSAQKRLSYAGDRVAPALLELVNPELGRDGTTSPD